jgi:hypothetical protein
LGAVRRDVFNSIGGFDNERFAVPSIEDIELGVRLREAGHRILLTGDIQAKHLKKWEIVSLVRTEIFCRAMPWSKLILTRQKMINDMNLKTNDRLSAALVGLSLLLVPFVFWQPLTIVIIMSCLFAIFFLNRQIFSFFARKKGILFTFGTFWWQYFYFFYSGVTFVFCWFYYALPLAFGFGKEKEIGEL